MSMIVELIMHLMPAAATEPTITSTELLTDILRMPLPNITPMDIMLMVDTDTDMDMLTLPME